MGSVATEATVLTQHSRLTSKSLRSLRLKRIDEEPHFTSAFGLVMASLGCMIGSGNIWRFPKVAAQSSDGKGCLVFILIWLLFVFLWSIPMVILEYGIGRYTKVTLIKTFKRMMGQNFIWGGIWISVVTFLVACYYAVIVGWCLYYSCIFIAQNPPTNYTESKEILDHFVQESAWGYITLLATVLLTGLICLGGIISVEKVNMVLVPVTFIILLATFIWAMTRHAAGDGLRFLFYPHWDSFLSVHVWGEAAYHNLLCVSAGMGLLLTYSNFLTEENGVVRYGVLIAIGNNAISLLVAMMMFAIVFAAISPESPELLSEVLAAEGPGGTGVTFIWLPIIFGSLGFAGRLLCIVFFFCLFLYGLTAIVACIFVSIRNLNEAFEVSRPLAIFLVMNLMYCVGIGSIMSPEFLRSQDKIWNSGLIISALLLVIMSVKYGITKLREKGINEKSLDDWNLPVIWELTIRYLCPIEIILILIWWLYDVITRSLSREGHWYDIVADGVLTYIIAWVCLLLLALFMNMLIVCCRPRWFMALEDELWEEDDMDGLYDIGGESLMGDAPHTAAPGVYDEPAANYGALDDVDGVEETALDDPASAPPAPPAEATDTT
ncbi:uncharacterized sodium-dependent transporter HI_0736-like isoform X2 [Lineus longissimus]|uniref:uncharacterized sodium-dependent transporter HI_0736-like isoform X2 n=1 Tax=Lineus longissimus TaxID=88925 RepID=UPI002B4E2CE1